jgi:DNA-binding transcriptional ArsR family regulator
VDRTLSALSDPTRRRVVELLREGPRRAGELATATGASPPVMSRHLRVLRQSELVEVELVDDDGRGRVYRLRRPALTDLAAWLDQVQAFWDEQLGAFKDHAERSPR